MTSKGKLSREPIVPPKVWQQGFDLAYLSELEHRFMPFNAYARGPFAEMNKPQIAQALRDGTMQIRDWGIVNSSFPRFPAPITAYQDVVIAQKLAGDHVITAFCYDHSNDEYRKKLIEHLATQTAPTYLWIWQESADERDIAEKAGYEFIACKISSMAEIRGLWFKEADTGFFPRRHPEIDRTEWMGCARVNIELPQRYLNEAVVEIAHIATEYTDHYSNYNKKHTWSALSLRGYLDNPAFIIKPAEMNKKWHADNPNDFELQDTPLRAALPAVDRLHQPLTALGEPHRIRLMKLEPQGGELRRHTDQVDKDSGIADGKVARFHIPLITTDGCEFESWDLAGQRSHFNMRVGECWYLDTRKPHTAVNHGSLPRIHLVVDVEANAQIRELLV